MPKAKSIKSEQTRQSLLVAAHRLFHEKGFEGTAVREITEAAGVSKGTFYLYFETKFDILKAYSKEFLVRFSAVVQRELAEPDAPGGGCRDGGDQYRKGLIMTTLPY